jgi:serine/threonine protein kinase
VRIVSREDDNLKPGEAASLFKPVSSEDHIIKRPVAIKRSHEDDEHRRPDGRVKLNRSNRTFDLLVDTALPVTPRVPIYDSPKKPIKPTEALSADFVHRLLTYAGNGQNKHGIYLVPSDGYNFTIKYDSRLIAFVQGELIGAGAFGDVYKYNISELRYGKSVGTLELAAKICRHETLDEVHNEINKSSMFAGRAGSPHIANYRGAWRDVKLFFMDLYPGSLKDYFEKRLLPLDLNKQHAYCVVVEDIITQLVDALYYMHYRREESVFHLDLTTANILIQEKHGKVEVAITDFGCSRTVARIKEAGLAGVGTFSLTAPERLSDGYEKTIDGYSKATDAWSLGLLIKRMLDLSLPTPVRPGEEAETCGFGRHMEYLAWGKDGAYAGYFKDYLTAESAFLSDRPCCALFAKLNSYANQLLSPYEVRPTIKEFHEFITESHLAETESRASTPPQMSATYS